MTWNVVTGLSSGASGTSLLTDSRVWLVGLLSLYFFSCLKFQRGHFVQPFLFLGLAVIPYSQSPETLFGFGFFAVAVVELFIQGRLSRRPVLKISLLGVYLLTMVFLGVITTRVSFNQVVGFLLFMGAFFLFLFFAFQERIIVFVRADRPVVRLSDLGLTSKEAAHILKLLEGKSVKEIGFEFGVKESTVRNSLSRSYHKLGFTDKSQVLQWAGTRNIKA